MSTKASHIDAFRIQNNNKRPRFTGRQLLLLNPGTKSSAILGQAKKASLRLASTADFRPSASADFLYNVLLQADGIVFDKLKVAIINENRNEQVQRLIETGSTAKNFLHTEPERYVYAMASKRKKEAVVHYRDNAIASWGIQAMNCLDSKFSGKGINVAVLDTGADLSHPDLKELVKKHKSFINGQQVTDLNGHGTHCAGLVAGGLHASRKFRYGVAKEVNLHIGKVLDNDGVGTDASILAGIDWAITNKCRIISLSLGGMVEPGETYSTVYETVARDALRQNCLIISAAGNESERSDNFIAPVNHPANCPSVMAVGALTQTLGVADFSGGSINKEGGQVDIAAPGLDIWSSYKNKAYRRLSGTSMATPLVAGLAALLCEADKNATASMIWMQLMQQARRLNLPATDVGAGLAFCRL